MLIGGSYYRTGISNTTLQRAPGADAALTIFADSWAWTGAVARRRRARRHHQPQPADRWTAASWLPLLADRRDPARPGRAGQPAHAGLAEQARHDGSLVRRDRRRLRRRRGHRGWPTSAGHGQSPLAACAAALALPAVLGIAQARTFATDWPNSTSFTEIFGPLVQHATGRVLVEDPSIAEYYLPAGQRLAAVVGHQEHRAAVRRQHWRAEQDTPGSSAPATPASTPSSSRRATSPWSRSTSPTPPPLDQSIRADLQAQPSLPNHRRGALRPGARHLRHLAIRAAPMSAAQPDPGADRRPAPPQP